MTGVMTDAGEERDRPVEDDLADDAVLRRISDGGPNMVAVDSITGERSPTSGAFKPDDDGVSVFRERRLADVGLGPNAIVRREVNLVVRLPVSAVRSIEPLDVKDDPWPCDVDDLENPAYVAHALIVGWEGFGKKQRLSRQRLLASHPDLAFVVG